MTQQTKLPPALFSNLSDIRQTLDRLFDPNLFDSRENWLANVVGSNWVPTIDIKDEADQYVITADIPGVEPNNIEVTISKGILTIKGHKETEKKEKQENFVHVERVQGSFYRSISLPNAADSSKISAKSKNGVLEIKVPKSKESTAQKIQIKEE